MPRKFFTVSVPKGTASQYVAEVMAATAPSRTQPMPEIVSDYMRYVKLARDQSLTSATRLRNRKFAERAYGVMTQAARNIALALIGSPLDTAEEWAAQVAARARGE